MPALMHIFSLYFSSENNWITKQLAYSMRSNSELSRPHPSALPTIFSRRNVPPNLYTLNEVIGITNDFLYPSNSKTYVEEPRYNETSL